MNKYKFLSKLYLSFSIIISISIAIIFTGQFIQDYSSYKKPKFAPPTQQERAMVSQNNEFDPDKFLAEKEDHRPPMDLSFLDEPVTERKFPLESLLFMIGSIFLPGIFFYLSKKWLVWLTT